METSTSLPRARPAVKPVKIPVVAVKFWWGGYAPERAFDPIQAPDVALEARSTDAVGLEWQPARPGSTLADVADYMLLNGLRVLDVERIAQRHTRQGWKGLYVVQIGTQTTMQSWRTQHG